MGGKGAPGSCCGSPSGTRVGAAGPSKCAMTPSWTSTPVFIPALSPSYISVRPLAPTPVPAHPSTLHDLSLEVLGGQDQDMDGLHEACAGAQDPVRQTPLNSTCGAAALLQHLSPSCLPGSVQCSDHHSPLVNFQFHSSVTSPCLAQHLLVEGREAVLSPTCLSGLYSGLSRPPAWCLWAPLCSR